MKKIETNSENQNVIKATQGLLLNERTALVCGASQGIGEAIATKLASRGARVVLIARQKEKLQKLCLDLNQNYPVRGDHQFYVQDLADLEGLKSQLLPKLSQIDFDILVNNAGGPSAGPLLQANVDQFEVAFKTHLFSSQLLVQALVPSMQKKQFGRIVNIISTSVKAPISNLGVSNTVRAAVANWSKTLANELGQFGITVNNVLPGYIRTSRFESLRSAAAQKQNLQENEIEKQWQSSVPVKKIGESEDMAEAVAFLASPAAGYISGVNLPVDGGRTASL